MGSALRVEGAIDADDAADMNGTMAKRKAARSGLRQRHALCARTAPTRRTTCQWLHANATRPINHWHASMRLRRRLLASTRSWMVVVGFAYAPLTKVVMAGLCLTSLLVSLLSLKLYIPFRLHPHILVYHQYWQAWAYHVAFTNSSELFLGIMILYYGARHVERACGSRKYGVCTRYSR